MNSKQAKAIRKAEQFTTRQVTEVFNEVMERQLAQPFKIRWRTALKILMGKDNPKDKTLLILFFILSQCLAIGISLLTYHYLMQ